IGGIEILRVLTACANNADCPAVQLCDTGFCQPTTTTTTTSTTTSTTTTTLPPCANNADCNDPLFCNGLETCNTGTGDCEPGTDPCDDTVGCTDDSCDEGTDSCTNTPNDANCANGDYCDGDETCDAGLDCQAGTAVDCDDLVLCTDDSCNEGTDSCDNIPNDANCDDANVCTDDVCNANADCGFTNNTDPCDDGLSCTTPDVCAGGICTSTDTCPVGQVCDPATDSCQADADSDGIPDLDDNCPSDANPTQDDADGDMLGDTCDPCVNNARNLGISEDPITGCANIRPADFRINSGELVNPFVDTFGLTWSVDGNFSTPSSTSSTVDPIANTANDTVYRKDRNADDLTYTLDTGMEADYIINLHFAEIFDPTGPGDRTMDVFLPDGVTEVRSDLDIVSEAGGVDTALIKSFLVHSDTGVITITLSITSIANNSKISGIEVLRVPTACTVDGDCPTGQVCDAGFCELECLTAPDCDDGNVCTDDACNAGVCEYTNNTLSCDDGLSCTDSDVCAGGVCDGTDNCDA
ncbi:MAG: hypothetical protein MI867_23315, partial [Pseudomonadales bacterium]|nr:hypothetical protein [Pseudomonadales bacterium]